MDDDKKTPSDEQPKMLQLPDGLVGETETDNPQLHVEVAMEMVAEAEPKHVSFELPGTSWQGTLQQRQQLDEAKALVKDMIEIMLPRSEPEKDADEATLMQEQTAATPSPSTSDALRYNDARLQRILRLLDRYTRNLEAIEEHVQSANSGQRSTVQLDGNTELQVTQHCELATQTLPVNSLRLDVTSTFRPKSHIRSSQQQPQQPQHQQQQQQLNQQVDIMPPCERRYHTITISTNSSSAFAAPARPRTLLGRIGQTLGDFAGAFCLCLQVNKDCVFCLGFFIAFVISASFLTAFFYRTINLTQTQLRVPLEGMENTPATTSDMVTLRFNGGYYYIYNSQRQHFV
ncbi:uncharacterized protein LOC115758769 [Drosophila novamexicana]|uniref:uncharacterized protein LOC115758769 n=1 Tax=Drosophila novamexicana TaxID=47314 RepID=UPI0011E5958F|nr:uncharacterized protein LOC115758769 [Drosophila novamexicana]